MKQSSPYPSTSSSFSWHHFYFCELEMNYFVVYEYNRMSRVPLVWTTINTCRSITINSREKNVKLDVNSFFIGSTLHLNFGWISVPWANRCALGYKKTTKHIPHKKCNLQWKKDILVETCCSADEINDIWDKSVEKSVKNEKQQFRTYVSLPTSHLEHKAPLDWCSTTEWGLSMWMSSVLM